MNTALREKPKPKEEEPDPLDADIEVVEVPRRYIREYGWPSSYAAIKAVMGQSAVHRERRGNVVMKSYDWQRPEMKEVAYFRDGGNDVAHLYVQTWRGEA